MLENRYCSPSKRKGRHAFSPVYKDNISVWNKGKACLTSLYKRFGFLKISVLLLYCNTLCKQPSFWVQSFIPMVLRDKERDSFQCSTQYQGKTTRNGIKFKQNGDNRVEGRRKSRKGVNRSRNFNSSSHHIIFNNT